MSLPRMLPLRDRPWLGEAKCRDAEPDAFFPPPGSVVGAAAAKAICARCPVREECLAWALVHGEDAGIWGGLSEAERAALRRRNRRRPA